MNDALTSTSVFKLLGPTIQHEGAGELSCKNIGATTFKRYEKTARTLSYYNEYDVGNNFKKSIEVL